MLFNEITNIIALSYSELGSIGLTIARNFNNGYSKSQKQKLLIKNARLIQMELKTVLDHVVYDDDGNVSHLIRSTDEQINKSLTYLIDLTEIQDYSTGPTLFHKLKPSRIYNTATILFQYSVDGLAWHDPYAPGDAYLRVSVDAGTTWTGAILFYNEATDKVSKSGDTMSGNLVIPDGTIAGHAVNKGQLDAVASAAATDATTKANAAEAAANTYADNLTLGLWDDRGNFDASVNAYPSSGGSGIAGAIMKGDIWTVSVAGTLPTGLVVAPGDTVRALIDTPGNTQANWAIAENNIGYAPVNKSGDTMSGPLAMGGHKVTGLAEATNPGEAVRYEQLPAAPTISGTPDLLYKTMNIGAWNMDTTASVSFAHGIASGNSKIISISAKIYTDSGSSSIDFTSSVIAGVTGGGGIDWNDTNVGLERVAGGLFDSATYDDAVMNRGEILIIYKP